MAEQFDFPPGKQGETYERVLTFRSKTTGNPIDISGWLFSSQVRIDENSEIAMTATITVRSPGSLGKADLRFDIPTNLPARTYKTDIKITMSGKTKFYIQGEFTVEPAITQS